MTRPYPLLMLGFWVLLLAALAFAFLPLVMPRLVPPAGVAPDAQVDAPPQPAPTSSHWPVSWPCRKPRCSPMAGRRRLPRFPVPASPWLLPFPWPGCGRRPALSTAPVDCLPPLLKGGDVMSSVTSRAVLVLGGARSGKSRFAEGLCEQSGLERHYVATGRAWDDEMRDRIAKHRLDRGDGWVTHEEPLQLADILRGIDAPDRVVLVDCLTLWVTNLMLDEADIPARARSLQPCCQRSAPAWCSFPTKSASGLCPKTAWRVNSAIMRAASSDGRRRCGRSLFYRGRIAAENEGLNHVAAENSGNRDHGLPGAGKTTIIRNMLMNANGKKIALIINEFGDLGVDGDVLKGCGAENCTEDDIIELTNGCICCTVADDFVPTMQKLLDRDVKPDHIVIETSGLALPQPLVAAFNWPDIRTRVTVDGVVTVVDSAAVAAGRFADDHDKVDAARAADESLDHESPIEELFEDQLTCADLIVLNKTDLLDANGIAAVRAEVTGRTHRKPAMIEAKKRRRAGHRAARSGRRQRGRY